MNKGHYVGVLAGILTSLIGGQIQPPPNSNDLQSDIRTNSTEVQDNINGNDAFREIIVPVSSGLDLDTNPISTSRPRSTIDHLLERRGILDKEKRDELIGRLDLAFSGTDVGSDVSLVPKIYSLEIFSEDCEDIILERGYGLDLVQSGIRSTGKANGCDIYFLEGDSIVDVTWESFEKDVNRYRRPLVIIPGDIGGRILTDPDALKKYNRLYEKCASPEGTPRERGLLRSFRKYNVKGRPTLNYLLGSDDSPGGLVGVVTHDSRTERHYVVQFLDWADFGLKDINEIASHPEFPKPFVRLAVKEIFPKEDLNLKMKGGNE